MSEANGIITHTNELTGESWDQPRVANDDKRPPSPVASTIIDKDTLEQKQSKSPPMLSIDDRPPNIHSSNDHQNDNDHEDLPPNWGIKRYGHSQSACNP